MAMKHLHNIFLPVKRKTKGSVGLWGWVYVQRRGETHPLALGHLIPNLPLKGAERALRNF